MPHLNSWLVACLMIFAQCWQDLSLELALQNLMLKLETEFIVILMIHNILDHW